MSLDLDDIQYRWLRDVGEVPRFFERGGEMACSLRAPLATAEPVVRFPGEGAVWHDEGKPTCGFEIELDGSGGEQGRQITTGGS